MGDRAAAQVDHLQPALRFGAALFQSLIKRQTVKGDVTRFRERDEA